MSFILIYHRKKPLVLLLWMGTWHLKEHTLWPTEWLLIQMSYNMTLRVLDWHSPSPYESYSQWIEEKIFGLDAIPPHKLSNLTDFVQYVQLSSWDEFPIHSECVWSGEAQLFNAIVLIFLFICSTWLDWPSLCSSLLFFLP